MSSYLLSKLQMQTLVLSSLMHGTQTEFKNFTRGVNCFIGDSDAQMLITRIEERQKFTKDFSFDYFVEDAELCGLFWADEVAKCNYKEFGDIVSFDAAYKTNKYKMVFVPFTTIDNHRRFVTVGSGLLKKETTEAYGWLLRAFKKAFVRPFNLVIVFRIYDDTDLKDKFGKIVWNMFIGPEEFEDRWNKLMEEFNLVNHKWLSKMKRISKKRSKNQTKMDKTKHGMEKRGKDKVKSKPKTKKVKVKSQPAKVNNQNRADIEEYLMGPPEPI
ncbi:ankyrin repeat-containing domain-containing LTR copia-type protein [Tanacetum coccineum]